MCIRASSWPRGLGQPAAPARLIRLTENEIPIQGSQQVPICLLYTSDAADERSSVDLGGRRIIKKKTHLIKTERQTLVSKITIRESCMLYNIKNGKTKKKQGDGRK